MSKKTTTLTIKISREEKARLQGEADAQDLPLSTIVRQRLKDPSNLPTNVDAKDTPPKRNA